MCGIMFLLSIYCRPFFPMAVVIFMNPIAAAMHLFCRCDSKNGSNKCCSYDGGQNGLFQCLTQLKGEKIALKSSECQSSKLPILTDVKRAKPMKRMSKRQSHFYGMSKWQFSWHVIAIVRL
uniref:Uncharacterized protein n=1 Tax=Arundo donax TaxID=35708 RepID=A0A0A9GG13_ARUDO